MKKLNANELRSVDGGAKLTLYTSCGSSFKANTPWQFLKGSAHVLWCSNCMQAKKRLGYWYLTVRKSAYWWGN